jgi:hypothetical protein
MKKILLCFWVSEETRKEEEREAQHRQENNHENDISKCRQFSLGVILEHFNNTVSTYSNYPNIQQG